MYDCQRKSVVTGFNVRLTAKECHRLAVDGLHAGLHPPHLPCHVAAGQARTEGVHAGRLTAERAVGLDQVR